MELYRSDGTPLSALNGKHVALFGDSLSDPAATGAKWVAPFLAKTNPKTLSNYARGWCRWTFWPSTTYDVTHTAVTNTPDNVLWNQLNRLQKDIADGRAEAPDVLLLFAGLNDVMQSVSWGSVAEVFTPEAQSTNVQTLTNFCASVRFVCDAARDAWPDAQLILIAPTRASSYAEGVLTAEQLLLACGKEMGLPVIDPAACLGAAWYREAQQHIYYEEDGVHLTAAGGQLLGAFLAHEVERIL